MKESAALSNNCKEKSLLYNLIHVSLDIENVGVIYEKGDGWLGYCQEIIWLPRVGFV